MIIAGRILAHLLSQSLPRRRGNFVGLHGMIKGIRNPVHVDRSRTGNGRPTYLEDVNSVPVDFKVPREKATAYVSNIPFPANCVPDTVQTSNISGIPVGLYLPSVLSA